MTTPSLFILYGSATGNAEHIAKDLSTKFDESCCCCELDKFKKQCVKTWEGGAPSIVLVVSSTTGNGDPPENAGRFMRFVKRCKDPLYFQHCQFAVLALGDTNYDNFCATGRAVDKKMGELGGKRLQSVALADEATGLEEVVEPWCEGIVVTVKAILGGDVAAVVTEEETKAEEEAPPLPAKTENVQSLSMGCCLVKSLLKKDESCSLSSLVDTKVLPSFGRRGTTRVVVCEELGTGAKDAVDAESVESFDDCTYTATSPFESTIVGARYLTNTETYAAKRVAANIDGAAATFNEAFPLQGPGAERNGKRVIELVLSTPSKRDGWDCQPGDSIGVLIPNHPPAVEYVLAFLQRNQGLAADTLVQIDERIPLTVKSALETIIDLSSPVPKSSKRMFWGWSQILAKTDPNAAACFHLLSSKGETGDLLCHQLCEKQRWTVVDFIKAFPTLETMTLEDLLDTAHLLPPRYYSVASSPMDETLSIGFSVVDYITPSLVLGDTEIGQRRIRGVATGLLEVLSSAKLSSTTDMIQPSTIPIFPKPTDNFRMPGDPKAKLILIGPGTGIAPFMGFLRHKRLTNATSGEIDVYFGCRHEDHDFLFRSELEELSKEGIITNLFVSFSRDEGSKFRYVQDRLKEQSERVVELVSKEDAFVYLCGDGNAMAKDVQATFLGLFQESQGDAKLAKDYLDDLKSSRRFVMDIWS